MENEKGMMLSDEELAADEETCNMETSNSGPTPLQIKNVEHRADTWSSLFQKHSHRSWDLQHHSQPSKDPNHHIEFDE